MNSLRSWREDQTSRGATNFVFSLLWIHTSPRSGSLPRNMKKPTRMGSRPFTLEDRWYPLISSSLKERAQSSHRCTAMLRRIIFLKTYLWSRKSDDSALKFVFFDGEIPNDFKEYRSLLSEFQSKLNSSGGGMCVTGARVLSIQGPTHFSSKTVYRLGTAMKPCTAGNKAAYRYASGETPPDLAESINNLAADGYSLVPGSFDFMSALMEKVN